MTGNARNILVVAHARRPDTVLAARRVIAAVAAGGATAVLPPDDDELRAELGEVGPLAILGAEVAVTELELAVVLGGDGTILRAAELVRTGTAPIFGINMGHVGFLAEIEADVIDDAMRRVLEGDYAVEERMTLDVEVRGDAGELIYETWALNEATVEKAARERMMEVVMEIDGRPLSSFGCDGVVIATPTGSTAYNFSAGGPVIWPTVEAIAVVPLSAHALFARPLVLAPDSTVAIEVLQRTDGVGILWADGRRSHDLPPGARVVARRAAEQVRLARLHPAPFTDRLVRKFQLPVTGWRGPEMPADPRATDHSLSAGAAP